MLDSSARRLIAVLVLGALATGCGGEKPAAPDAAPTPIARLEAAAMQVPRIEFCPLVPKSAVTDALGGKAVSADAYGNGDEQELVGIGKDVVHEIGCAWTGTDLTARAWVFARPISGAFARQVIADARKTEGCRVVAGPAFGTPSITQVCATAGGQRVRHAGLFGQTWLTCELSATSTQPTDLRQRTDQWCVEVANALDTTR